MSSPTLEELAAEAEQAEQGSLEPGNSSDAASEEDPDGLDPDIFGPAELGRNVDASADGSTPSEMETQAEAEPADEAAEAAEPAEPAEPEWFERSRIAMALRSGEVLLLGHKAPQAVPADIDSEDDGEQGDGEGRRGPPATPEAVPF